VTLFRRRAPRRAAPNAVHTDALALQLTHEPVPEAQLVAGAPSTGFAVLSAFDGREYGVWEMSEGAMSDTEADEVFVVLAGEASVLFVDTGVEWQLAAGSVGRFTEGQRTVWTVTRRLRKVYLS
jgi:uncharacterized protein